MPERLRKIVSRLREYVGNRRRAPRRRARLTVAVSLLEERPGAPPTLTGHTRDVSASGLGLILPAVRIGDRYLAGEGQTLRIVLQLPEGHARLYGTPVRYERLDPDDADTGYLVGVRLTDSDDRDRAAFNSYLKSIR